MDITADFNALGLPKKASIRDLWSQKEMGKFTKSITLTLPKHASALLKVKSAG